MKMTEEENAIIWELSERELDIIKRLEVEQRD